MPWNWSSETWVLSLPLLWTNCNPGHGYTLSEPQFLYLHNDRGPPDPATPPSCKNTSFGNKNFSLLDVWPPAPQSSSLASFPHLWNKDFWSCQTWISIKSQHSCLVTCVDGNCENLKARNIYKDSTSSVQTHTHTTWEGTPGLSFQSSCSLAPSEHTGWGGTGGAPGEGSGVVLGASGFSCPLSPGAKS